MERLSSGTDTNVPNGSGQMQFRTVGAAVFPTPKLVLKLELSEGHRQHRRAEPGRTRSWVAWVLLH